MKLLATSFLLYLSFLLDDLAAVNAIRISGKPRPSGANAPLHSFGRRATMAADLKNTGDVDYYTNVTMAGKVFSALIDTGSSDLWVASSLPGSADTGKTASVQYAIGAVSGPIKTVEVDFEGYHIKNQAYIEDQSGSHTDGQALIGLGPSSGSEVRQTLNSATGNPVLDRIFRQNTTTPNFISIYLGRSIDPTDPFPGDLTVGTIIPGYEQVTSQPKLEVFDVPSANGQHWQTLLDKNGIIGPDGNPVQVTSHVKGSDPNRLNAIFDSGFSFSQVPQAVADAFYGRIPGANIENISGVGQVYTVPCDVEVNVTFKLGNISYPIHPLDATISTLGKTDASGNTICLGSFQPILQSAVASTYDMILGMSFLRNAYILINFGDFVDGSTSKTADGFVQLLSITNDSALTHKEFVEVRLHGVDDTGNFHLLPASILPTTNDSNSAISKESLWDRIHPYLPYIIAGAATLGAALLIWIAFCIMSSRRKRYRPLHDPAPMGIDTHQHQPPFTQYQQPYAPHQQPPFTQYQPQRRY